MAATRSFGSAVLPLFYAVLILFLIRKPILNKSKYVLNRSFELLLPMSLFTRDIEWIFIVKLCSEYQVDLKVNGYFKSRLTSTKWSKHGQTSLHIPGYDPPLDITVFSDVARNPGPVYSSKPNSSNSSCTNLHVAFSTITCSRDQLFAIRRISDCTLADKIFADFKRSGLFHSRGRRGGRQDSMFKIESVISNRAATARNIRSALVKPSQHMYVNKINLKFIPRAPQLLNCQQQPLKFARIMLVRFVRKHFL